MRRELAKWAAVVTASWLFIAVVATKASAFIDLLWWIRR